MTCYVVTGDVNARLDSRLLRAFACRAGRQWRWVTSSVMSAERFPDKRGAIRVARYLDTHPRRGQFSMKAFNLRVIHLRFYPTGAVWRPPEQTKVWPNPDALGVLSTLNPGVAL